MHGMEPHDEIDYWRARAEAAKVRLAAANAEIERLRADADRHRRHRMAPERCPVCSWTNVCLMNYGSHERGAKWMCHGCAARSIEQLSAMTAARNEACDIAEHAHFALAASEGEYVELNKRISTLRKVGSNG